MAYTKTNWINDSVPAINAGNLNKIEQGIYDNSVATEENTNNIGDLDNLTTQNNSNLVEAINEVNTVSIAKLKTNGSLSVPSSVEKKVTGIWTNEFEYGDYVADVQNNRIVVTNTEVLEVTGLIGGQGPSWSGISVRDENDVAIDDTNSRRILNTQSGYWSSSLPNSYYRLDKTKTYYVYLYCVGYNGTFELNSGMGDKGTVISARKIK